MEEQTQIISSNNMKLTNIELEKKQKLEKKRNCRDKQEQIEAQIKQLQKEKRDKSELERSLNGDIDRLSQKHRDVQYLISQSTFNNISVISWRSVLLMDETRVIGENH